MIHEKAKDPLGVIYRLIFEHAYEEPSLPKLKPEQIIRARQSLALAPSFKEFVILNTISSVKHGTNEYGYILPNEGNDIGAQKISKCIEHTIQVDFVNIDPLSDNLSSINRANLFELLASSYFGIEFVNRANSDLSILYVENINYSGDINENHLFRNRASLLVHMNEVLRAKVPLAYIDNVNIKTRNVDIKLN